MSPEVASVTGAVCASSCASAERAADRAMGRARIASRRRPNSATTVASPIRTKPPVKALTPATMSVVPSVNSLMGMPNPIAATPAAVTAMPNSDKIVAMFAPRPGPAMRGSSHGAMVIKEFWPRCTPIAITNVTPRPPNPILINPRRSIHRVGGCTPTTLSAPGLSPSAVQIRSLTGRRPSHALEHAHPLPRRPVRPNE